MTQLLENGKVKGIRKCLTTGKEREDTFQYGIYKGTDGKLWVRLKNGPRGNEAIPFKTLPAAIVRHVPWAPGRWHALKVPWEELQKVYERHKHLLSQK